MNTQFDNTIIEMIENAARNTQLKPIYLNGPGGSVGQLPQEKVKYDATEAASSGYVSASGNPTLVDNLNHIRYRIEALEHGGIGEEEDPIFTASEAFLLETGDKALLDELTGGGLTTLHYHTASSGAGGGGSLGSFWIDGAIVEMNNASNPIVIVSDITVLGDWAFYLENSGDSGTTTVNVWLNRTGESPTALFGTGIELSSTGDPVFSAQSADVEEFLQGDVLTVEITDAALGARGLNIVPPYIQAITISGGSSGTPTSISSYPLDAVPTSPNSRDDEFSGSSLDAKWTHPINSVCLSTVSVSSSWLSITSDVSGKRVVGIMQAMPTGSFSVSAKLVEPDLSGYDIRSGLFMGVSGGLAHILGPFVHDVAHGVICSSTLSTTADWASYDGYLVTRTFDVNTPSWLRIRWNASTSTMYFDLSVNGVAWGNWTSRNSLSQPGYAGICIYSNGANLAVGRRLFADWFRVVENADF